STCRPNSFSTRKRRWRFPERAALFLCSTRSEEARHLRQLKRGICPCRPHAGCEKSNTDRQNRRRRRVNRRVQRHKPQLRFGRDESPKPTSRPPRSGDAFAVRIQMPSEILPQKIETRSRQRHAKGC